MDPITREYIGYNLTITTMKAPRKFENVKEGNTVSFYCSDRNIKEGMVSSVNKNTFSVRTLECYDRNGVKHFYDSYHNFFKTGTKSHARYTYGNAIEITTNFE